MADHRVLDKFRIDELSGVDFPAQTGARAVLMKRDFSAEERRQAATSGAALPDGSFPIKTVEDLKNAVHDIGRAKDEAAAKAHIISRAKSLGATDQLPEGWISKAGEPGANPDNAGVIMSELTKALGLADTATEADIAKAVGGIAAKVEELTKANAKAEALAKMSDKHKAFMDHPDAKLPKGGRDAFASMEPSERDDHISANPIDDGDGDEAVAKALKSGDAFKTPAGVIVSKRKVGPELYDVLKSQNALLISQGADLAKAKEDAAVADFAKRAADLGFEPAFGATLRKAYGGDAAAQGDVEKQLAALRKQAETGGLFASFGKSSPEAGSAEGELMAKIDEVKKADPKLKDAQAYSKVYTDPANRDIVKRMKAEAAA